MTIVEFLLARYAEDRRFLEAATAAGNALADADTPEGRNLGGSAVKMIGRVIEEDREFADALRPYVWVPMPSDTARIMAELDAKVAFVEFAARSLELSRSEPDGDTRLSMDRRCAAYWTAMKFMAKPFEGHPEFDPAWRP